MALSLPNHIYYTQAMKDELKSILEPEFQFKVCFEGQSEILYFRHRTTEKRYVRYGEVKIALENLRELDKIIKS